MIFNIDRETGQSDNPCQKGWNFHYLENPRNQSPPTIGILPGSPARLQAKGVSSCPEFGRLQLLHQVEEPFCRHVGISKFNVK